MSLVNLFKVAQTASKTSKLFKAAATGGKVIWTLAEIADFGMDSYILGDEIARAILGDQYDSEVYQLSREVAEKGIAYDKLMSQIAEANSDITNLLAAINALYGLNDDFEIRAGLIFEKVQKLDALKERLSQSAPTTYDWFERSALPVSISDDARARLEQIRQQLGPNYVTIGLHSAGIGLRMAFVSYSLYKKRKGSTVPTRPRRNAMSNIFEGMDPAEVERIRSNRTSRFKQVKARVKTYGTWTMKGVNKLATVGSFGMNIYMLIQREALKDAAKASLREMIARYTQDIHDYGFILNGCQVNGIVDEAALTSVAKVFEVNLADQTSQGRESLQLGYKGVLKQYDEDIDDIIDGMDEAYKTLIQGFNDVRVDSSDDAAIQQLSLSYITFQSLQAAGKDETKPSDYRKDTLDQIRTLFSNSVAQKLSEINDRLDKAIMNHQALGQIRVMAESLILDEQEEEIPITDRRIARKSTELKTNLDTIFPKRDRFLTVEDITVVLRKLVDELKAKTPVSAMV